MAITITTIKLTIPPEHPITDESVLSYASSFVKKVSEADPKTLVRLAGMGYDKITASLLDGLVICLLKKFGREEHYMSCFSCRPDGSCVCMLYCHEDKELLLGLGNRLEKRSTKKSQM